MVRFVERILTAAISQRPRGLGESRYYMLYHLIQLALSGPVAGEDGHTAVDRHEIEGKGLG